MSEQRTAKNRVLMVVTSNSQLGNTGRSTGLWAEELAAPYRVFEEAGLDFDIASPAGGPPPIDDISLLPDYFTPVVKDFLGDPAVASRLRAVRPLADVSADDYDGVFVVGGFGVMWDLIDHPDLTAILARTAEAGRPIAAVCHAPAALAGVVLNDGTGLVDGRAVTGFSNDEEATVALGVDYARTVEDALRAAGGAYENADQVFEPHVVTDGHLHTGQNPASSLTLAQRLVANLRR